MEMGWCWGEGLRKHKEFPSLMILHLSERARRIRVGKVAGLEDEKQIWDML